MLNKIKASSKLYLLVFIMSVFIVSIGWYGINELKIVNQDTQTLYADRVLPIEQLTSVRFSYVGGILSATQQAKSHQISFAEAHKLIVEAENSITSNWKAYMLTYLTPEEEELAKQSTSLIGRAAAVIEKLKVTLTNTDAKSFDAIVNEELYTSINPISTKLNQLIALQVKVGGEIYKSSEEVYETASKKFYIFIILCLAFAIPFSFYIVRNVKELIKNLVDSEKKYRNIFENVQEVFYQTSLEGIILDVSPSIEYHTGYKRNDLLGTFTGRLFYDIADREEGLMVLKEKGQLKDYEVRFKSSTGALIHALLDLRLINDANGNPSHLDGAFRNITARKQAEENLMRSEARLKEAQAIAHTGNWEIDMVNKTHIWSDEFYKIYGINKNEVNPSTETMLSFMHPDDLIFAEEEIRETYTTFKSSASSFRFIRKDGVMRFGYIEWRFEFDKDNKPIRLYGILQDITDRKIAEAEREKMITDILQRNKNFEQFSYIVSHNLRAPVSKILGIANVLKSDILEKERIEFQQYLFEAVEQLDEIIRVMNNILQVRNQVTEVKESIHFSQLVSDIKSGIPNADVEIHTDFSAIDDITTIKSYIASIFNNLISNSIKFRQEEKESIIWIKTNILNEKIRISLKDNGRGIDLERFREKIFGLYQRFHLNTEGKGLGLFMVKTHIEILGGTISVKSEPDVGTEFIIELPV